MSFRLPSETEFFLDICCPNAAPLVLEKVLVRICSHSALQRVLTHCVPQMRAAVSAGASICGVSLSPAHAACLCMRMWYVLYAAVWLAEEQDKKPFGVSLTSPLCPTPHSTCRIGSPVSCVTGCLPTCAVPPPTNRCTCLSLAGT